ncbi:MAG: hypothetical protein IJF02_04990 [Oscillospiraceae bacterium]|nr:hypothetical protein [Oscillospiraceae bacterium]MBQ6852407.1 hypothetical protein [Oscillospiraceae bacterium]
MNTADYIKHEADEIASRTGRYIPPYRLANLMKTAQRITDLLVRSDIAMTYDEIQLVLGVVQGAVGKAIGRDAE